MPPTPLSDARGSSWGWAAGGAGLMPISCVRSGLRWGVSARAVSQELRSRAQLRTPSAEVRPPAIRLSLPSGASGWNSGLLASLLFSVLC